MNAAHTFAYFITPHGYGHAARAGAVMLALRQADPGVHFEIFTQVPPWFFEMTLGGGFSYHDLYTDVGLSQDSVMEENLPETVQRLSNLLPFRSEQVRSLAQQVKELNCEMVLCDIAPLGIAVANAAGLPSVLIENFTWDWIYEGYQHQEPRLAPYIEYLKEAFASASYHIRTEPACSDNPPADLTVSVVGRQARTPAQVTRAALGIPPEAQVVLLTMGGIGSEYPFLEQIEHASGVYFIIPGGSEQVVKRGSLVLMAHHSEFYHPDLVEAANAVIGKLGYSTLAEAYLAGIPYAFIPRPRFRESEVMGQFVLENMNGIEISNERFFQGEWLDALPHLLSIPRHRPTGVTGAEQTARFLLNIISNTHFGVSI